MNKIFRIKKGSIFNLNKTINTNQTDTKIKVEDLKSELR
jgi:hypothetical protein